MAWYKRPNPRQLAFVEYYTSPASPTFSNATQSAIRAGYSEQYAKTLPQKYLIPLAERMTEKQRVDTEERIAMRSAMLYDAERALHSDIKIPDEAVPAMRAIRQKSSALIAETLGKDVYSRRSETVNGGAVLFSDDTRDVLEITMRKYLEPRQNVREIAPESDESV